VISAGTNVTLRRFLNYKPHILTTSPSSEEKAKQNYLELVNLECPAKIKANVRFFGMALRSFSCLAHA
jgi:hypothetical protein